MHFARTADAASKLPRSFAAKDAAQDDKPIFIASPKLSSWLRLTGAPME
jgi:hypothetical protein